MLNYNEKPISRQYAANLKCNGHASLESIKKICRVPDCAMDDIMESGPEDETK